MLKETAMSEVLISTYNFLFMLWEENFQFKIL
jgi:hypothetical protein